LNLPLSSKPLLIKLAQASQNTGRILQDASLLSEEMDGKVKLILKTANPQNGSESIALTHQLNLGNEAISWEKGDDFTWHTYLDYLPPGNYKTAALLKDKDGQLVTTNPVNFEVKSHFSLNPNPSTGSTSLEVKRPFHEPSQLTIMSLDGQVVGNFVLPANETVLPLSLNHLKTGVYIFKLENSDFIERLRFLKK